jgi:hypothetical protein
MVKGLKYQKEKDTHLKEKRATEKWFSKKNRAQQY